jgi:hypothetical protein
VVRAITHAGWEFQSLLDVRLSNQSGSGELWMLEV